MAITGAAVCAPSQAQAYTVLTTITGTITSGTDVTGVFVGKNANLKGYPYTATFTFDTTQGVNSPVTPTQCYNGLHSSGSTTPVVQVELTINGSSYVFQHNANAPSIDSFVLAQSAGSSKAGLSFYFSESFNTSTGFTGGNNIGAEFTINSLSTALCRYWYNAFSYALKPPTDSQTGGTGFEIGKYQIVNGVSKQYQVAVGYFTVATVAVSGPITAQSSPHIYFLNVSKGQYSDVTNTTVPVVVGQPIQLFAIPAGQTSSWKLALADITGGFSFSGTCPTPTSPPPTTTTLPTCIGSAIPLTAADFASPATPLFYWTVPCSTHQTLPCSSYNVQYNGSNGSAYTNFDVEGPTVQPSISLGTVIKSSSGTFVFVGGNSNNLSVGMMLKAIPVSLPPDYASDPPNYTNNAPPNQNFSWVQVVDKFAWDLTYSTGMKECNGGTGLDTSIPYRCAIPNSTNFQQCGLIARDLPTLSPDTVQEYTGMNWNFLATTYFMWRATTDVSGNPVSGAIPIPLFNVTWGFSAKALRTGGVWSTPSSALQPSSPTFSDQPLYPQWSTIVGLPNPKPPAYPLGTSCTG